MRLKSAYWTNLMKLKKVKENRCETAQIPISDLNLLLNTYNCTIPQSHHVSLPWFQACSTSFTFVCLSSFFFCGAGGLLSILQIAILSEKRTNSV